VSVDQQFFHPTGTTAVVSIRPHGAPAFRQLAAVRIDDRPAGGRRWTPLRVDLAPHAGRRVTLRLEFRAARPLRGDRLAWFGSPRIVRAAPEAAAPRQGRSERAERPHIGRGAGPGRTPKLD